MKNLSKYFLIAATTIFALTSCNKDDENTAGTADLNIYLTDAPDQYENLYLEVYSVEVKVDEGWSEYTLDTPDTIDILHYQNGEEYLFYSDTITTGAPSEVRLVLGDYTKLILTDSTEHDLKVPSGSSSGLKVKITGADTLEADETYKLLIDFDVEESIVEKGNGGYNLKPVLHATIEKE